MQPDSTKPDKPASKVKSERQASLEKSKQVKTAKNEQNKKDKEHRQKQKDKEKEGRIVSCHCSCDSCCAKAQQESQPSNPAPHSAGHSVQLPCPVQSCPVLPCPALPCPALPVSTFIYRVCNLSGQLEAHDSVVEVSNQRSASPALRQHCSPLHGCLSCHCMLR